MRLRAARLSLPLSAQIVVLMLGVLVVAQVVTLFFTLLAPPSPPPQYRLQDVAAALRGDDVKGRGAHPLIRSIRKYPPSLNSAGWLVSERSRRELAGLLQTNEANVRLLFYSPLPFAGAYAAGARAQSGPVQGSKSKGAWPMVLGDEAATSGLTTVGYPLQGGPGPGPGGGGGGFDPGRGPRPPGPLSDAPGNRSGGSPSEREAGGRVDPSASPPPARPSSGGWQDPPTGTRIRPYTPPTPAIAPQAVSTPRVPASTSPAAAGRGDPGTAASNMGLPTAGQAPGFTGQGLTGQGEGKAQGSSPFSAGQGGQGQTFGGLGGQNRSGALSGQGPQGGGSQISGQGQGVPVGGPAYGPGVGFPAQGAPVGGRIPSVGQPHKPPHDVALDAKPAVHIDTIAPRPLSLAIQPRAQPIDLGLIAPAPMVAAQNNDAAGWIVGTPQEPARGLFGLAPSPFVQGDFVAAVRNASNQWITVAPQPEPFPNAWQRRVIWWFVAAFALVGPLGYLFARRLARPIDQFAAAAERLGREPTAPLAPLGGPAEIGRAAKAFNQMHSRLRRFVEDRTGMVGAISHDLRTPLARMRFRLERVPPDVRAGMLTDIQQMEEMISSVLIFIRDAAEPAVRERIDLRSLVECVVDDAAMVGGEAALDPGGPLSVDVDALGVQRVLTNLIDNALKYGERADVRLYHEDGDAVAEVTDAGPGLAADEIERVFLPFYRADHARGMNKGGIGLGLAVSRSIARAHGGDVLLTSDGRGLKAQLRLPLASKAA